MERGSNVRDGWHQVHDGEVVRPRMKNYYMKCCGCGVIHVLDFTVTVAAAAITDPSKTDHEIGEYDDFTIGVRRL